MVATNFNLRRLTMDYYKFSEDVGDYIFQWSPCVPGDWNVKDKETGTAFNGPNEILPLSVWDSYVQWENTRIRAMRKLGWQA